MISPMVNEKHTNVIGGKVTLKDYSQIGANTIVMPNVTLNEGSVTGAFSFVNKNLEEWSINLGIPCKKTKDRSKNILNIAKNMNEQ